MTPALARRSATPALAALLLFCLPPAAVQAAPDDISVDMDDLREPGKVGIEAHNNYVFSGRRTPAYPGEQPPAKVYRLTPELSYGLSPRFELGLKVLAARGADGSWHGDGGKAHVKYIAPHDADGGFFWGANLEVGRTAQRVSPSPWNAEVKGIAGYRTGPWSFAVNPNFDWSLSAGGGPATVAVDLKAKYELRSKVELAIESYNWLGPARHASLSGENARSIFAVVGKSFGDVDVDAGIGRGITGAADRWVLKFNVGMSF